ncbi:MAG: recombinase family protein, partial [Coprobacillaceae bacterium]
VGGDAVSIEPHTDCLRDYCEMMGIADSGKEIKIYVDDGYSASSLVRPQMQKLLKRIKKREIDIIITYDFDRISRDVVDTNLFLRMLQQEKIDLKCIRGDLSIKTANDRFGTNVKVAAKQLERETAVEKTNDALYYIAEKERRYPCGGKVPLGYRRGEDKDIYINDYEAELIREVFYLATQSYNLLDIAKHMNNQSKVKKFDTTVIERILKDKRYIGKMTYKGKEYTDIVPAIVTEEQQLQALENFKKTKKSNKVYFLNDVVYCNDCKQKLVATHGTGNMGKKYYYYRCKKCSHKIPQQYLVDSVISFDAEMPRKERELKSIQTSIRYMDKRIEHVKEKYLLGHYTNKEYCALILPLVEEKDKQKTMLEILKMNLYDREDFDALDPYAKTDYIQKNFKRMWVNLPAKRVQRIGVFD